MVELKRDIPVIKAEEEMVVGAGERGGVRADSGLSSLEN